MLRRMMAGIIGPMVLIFTGTAIIAFVAQASTDGIEDATHNILNSGIAGLITGAMSYGAIRQNLIALQRQVDSNTKDIRNLTNHLLAARGEE